MQTIKTGVVVALLLAVCYGAFVALNAPDADIPDELANWATDNEELNDLLEIEMPDVSQLPGGSSEFAGFDSAPSIPGATTDASSQLALPTLGLPTEQAVETVGLPALPSMAGPELLNLPPAGAGEMATPAMPALPAVMQTASGTPATTVSSTTNLDAPSLDIAVPSADGASVSLSPNNPASSSLQTGSSPVSTIPKFSLAREEWLAKARAGELRGALETLSQYYNSPELTHSEHSDLVDILDPLSSAVIYSKKHLLLPSHVVRPSETVASIAENYSITPELLAKINGLGNDKTVATSTKLKVLQGPFSAQVSISRSELTLFLNGLYAGRFSVSLGKEHYPTPGKFEVINRRKDRTYYGGAQTILSAGDPRNPYGGYWVSLGELSIHGSPEMASPELEDAGSISLAPLDASDVYDILTQGSPVTVVQ